MNTFNFLGLNGGGARTKLQLKMLKYLYELLGDDFFIFFEIIAGTSGGSLITSLLCTGKTPKEVEYIYDTELKNIFNGCFFREVVGKSKYGNKYLHGLATELLGSVRLGDLKQKIIIPTINTSKQETKIFKSFDEKDFDYKLVDVIVASSSAPRYFPAHSFEVEENYKKILQWFKDGGLSSNNPSDILALEGTNKKYKGSQINILSLTSGENKNIVTKAEKKGNLLSIPEMIDEMLNLQDKKSHGVVRTLYKNEVINGIYERCEAQIKFSNGKIDDVSSKNMELMTMDAELSLKINKEKIYNFYLQTRRK